MPTVKISSYIGYTVTTQGQGAYSLPAAQLLNLVSGNEGMPSRTIDSVYSNGTTGIAYSIYDGTDYEHGLGTLDSSGSPPTLARTEVTESSNADAAVSWGAGTRVLIVAPRPEDLMLLRNNLEGLASAATSRTNLGSTSVGDDLFTAVSAAAARSTLGLGSAAVEDAATAATADTVALRDGDGQLKSADPTANDDVATKGWSEGAFAPSGTLTAPSGTGLLLSAGSVPTGWTRQNAAERLAIQLAQAAESIGTTTGSWTTDSHTLTTSEMPLHSHSVEHSEFEFDQNLDGLKIVGSRVREFGFGGGTTVFSNTGGKGGGNGHTHGSNVKAMRVAEITKD